MAIKTAKPCQATTQSCRSHAVRAGQRYLTRRQSPMGCAPTVYATSRVPRRTMHDHPCTAFSRTITREPIVRTKLDRRPGILVPASRATRHIGETPNTHNCRQRTAIDANRQRSAMRTPRSPRHLPGTTRNSDHRPLFLVVGSTRWWRYGTAGDSPAASCI